MKTMLTTLFIAVMVSGSAGCFVRTGPPVRRRYWWYAAQATPSANTAAAQAARADHTGAPVQPTAN